MIEWKRPGTFERIQSCFQSPQCSHPGYKKSDIKEGEKLRQKNDGKDQFECLTQSQVKQVNPDESSPGPYNQADMDLVGRSRLATSSSLSVVPL